VPPPIINYKNLPRKKWWTPKCWDYSYDDQLAVACLREKLLRIDPNQDGKLTRSEMKRYYPRLDWNTLYATFAKFSQAWQKWSSFCRATPTSRTCVLGRGHKIVRLANTLPFAKPIDCTSRSNSALCKFVASRWKLIIFSQKRRLVEVSVSRLHPIKEYKIERNVGYSANNKNIVVKILHFSGKLTVLKGNLNNWRTFRFTRNPTGASVGEPDKILDPPPAGYYK
jgi:hypothetical protein